jgi:hypothetical protein
MAGNNLPINSDGSAMTTDSASDSLNPKPATAGKGFAEERPKLFRTQSNPENLQRYHRFDNDDYGWEPDRRRGCLTRFLTCRCMGCGCLIFLLLFTLFAIFVLWQRPPFIWNPVKTWLNGDLAPVSSGEVTASSAYANLNSQVSSFGVGLNKITITEKQLQAILRDKLISSNLNDLNVDMEPSALRVYWNVDSKEAPLWMVVELNTEDKTRIKFNKIGTERLPLPPFLNNLATELVASVLKFGANKAAEGNLLDVVFTAPANVEIQDIKLEHDQLILTVNVKNGLEHVFGN